MVTKNVLSGALYKINLSDLSKGQNYLKLTFGISVLQFLYSATTYLLSQFIGPCHSGLEALKAKRQ